MQRNILLATAVATGLLAGLYLARRSSRTFPFLGYGRSGHARTRLALTDDVNFDESLVSEWEQITRPVAGRVKLER